MRSVQKAMVSVLTMLALTAPLTGSASGKISQPAPVSLPAVSCPADAEWVSAIVRFPSHLTGDELLSRGVSVTAVIWEWGDDQTFYPVQGNLPSNEIRTFLKENLAQLIIDSKLLLAEAAVRREHQDVISSLKKQIATYNKQLEYLGGNNPLRFAAGEFTGSPAQVKAIKGGTVAACNSTKTKAVQPRTDFSPMDGATVSDYPEYRPYTGTLIWRPAEKYMDNFFRWTPEALQTFTGTHTGFEFDVKLWPSQLAECGTISSWDAPGDGVPRTYECKGPVTTNIPGAAGWYYDTRYLDPTGDLVEKDFTQGIENAGALSGYVTYHFKVTLKNINPNLSGLVFIDRQLQGDPQTSRQALFCRTFRIYIGGSAACNFAYQNEPERMDFSIRGDTLASYSW